MNVTRRDIRIEVMNALYQYDLYQSDALSFIPYFELEEAQEVFFEVKDHIKEIDQMIENNLFDYALYRLSYLDRAIIRLATYEMVYSELDPKIAINEAVELTKIYSNLDDEKQHKFTNKVLDNIAKSLKG